MIGPCEAAARARGTGFEQMRGAWLDRLIGHAKICALFDDPWGATAYAIECEACARADTATVAAWVAALGEASTRAWPLRATGLEVTGQFARIAIGVARLASERRPAESAEARTDVVASVARLLERDTEIDLTRPRYRWRLPWTGAGLEAFHAQLAPIFAEVPAPHPLVPDATTALARCEAAATAWRAQLRRGGEPADFAPRTGDLAAELAVARAAVFADCDAMLARDLAWPEPLRIHHAAALRAAATAAASPVALDLACTHAAACFEIEATWLRALVATVGAPLRAALVAAYEPSAAATASVAAAHAHAAALAGEPDPWRVPWFATLVETALVPHERGSLDGLGSYLGEGGIELLGPWRTWTGITGGTSAGLDPRQLTAPAASATTPTSSDSPRRIRLWDRDAPLAGAPALRSAPNRPPLLIDWGTT